KVRRNDRTSLGRDRRLLPAGKQDRPRLRRRPQQQNPCPPAPSLRPARRRISQAENPGGKLVRAMKSAQIHRLKNAKSQIFITTSLPSRSRQIRRTPRHSSDANTTATGWVASISQLAVLRSPTLL